MRPDSNDGWLPLQISWRDSQWSEIFASCSSQIHRASSISAKLLLTCSSPSRRWSSHSSNSPFLMLPLPSPSSFNQHITTKLPRQQNIKETETALVSACHLVPKKKLKKIKNKNIRIKENVKNIKSWKIRIRPICTFTYLNKFFRILFTHYFYSIVPTQR